MDFKDYLKMQNYSENTRKMYTLYYTKLSQDFSPITHDSIINFCQTYNNGVARAFLRCYLRGLLKRKDIKIPRFRKKREKRLPKFLTKDQVNLLIDATDNIELKMVIRIGFESGMRISEILSLTPNILKNKKIIGKGGVEGYFYITSRMTDILNDYISKHKIQLDERIFKFSRFLVNEKLARISKTTLGKRVSPHWLRHSCAIYLRQNGMDIMQIKEFLRHSNVATTAIYSHATDEEVKNKWEEIMES